jgi:hypothetical protein
MIRLSELTSVTEKLLHYRRTCGVRGRRQRLGHSLRRWGRDGLRRAVRKTGEAVPAN